MESSEGGPQGGIPLGKHLTGQAGLTGFVFHCSLAELVRGSEYSEKELFPRAFKVGYQQGGRKISTKIPERSGGESIMEYKGYHPASRSYSLTPKAKSFFISVSLVKINLDLHFVYIEAKVKKSLT